MLFDSSLYNAYMYYASKYDILPLERLKPKFPCMKNYASIHSISVQKSTYQTIFRQQCVNHEAVMTFF